MPPHDSAPATVAAAPPRRHTIAPLTVLLLLVGFFSLQPLSTDFYLPSLPGLVTRFGTTVAKVQLTLSVFVAGFGVGQLVLGPVSDRWGRRPVLLGGIAAYVIASLACALALSIEMLIAGRLLQAIGACACMVGARAIVRDLHAPAEGARVLAQSNGLMTVALVSGPIAGGLLEQRYGFRATFLALTLIALALLGATWRHLRETSPLGNSDAIRLAPMLAVYRRIGGNRTFWAYTLAMSTSYGGLFAFLAGSSFVFVKVLGLSPQQYGFAFAVVVIGYLGGTVACRKLVAAIGIRRTMLRAGALQALAGVAMAALALGGAHHVLAILIPQFFYNFAHAMTTPCCQAGAIAPFPNNAGTAAALMGFVQMAVAAAMGVWVGASYDGTVHPLTLTIGAAALCTLFASRVLIARWGRLDGH